MFFMRVTTSSCATGTIEPVIRGVLGVLPDSVVAGVTEAGPPGIVVGFD